MAAVRGHEDAFRRVLVLHVHGIASDAGGLGLVGDRAEDSSGGGHRGPFVFVDREDQRPFARGGRRPWQGDVDRRDVGVELAGKRQPLFASLVGQLRPVGGDENILNI